MAPLNFKNKFNFKRKLLFELLKPILHSLKLSESFVELSILTALDLKLNRNYYYMKPDRKLDKDIILMRW